MPPVSGPGPAPQQLLQQCHTARKTFYRGHDLELAALEPITYACTYSRAAAYQRKQDASHRDLQKLAPRPARSQNLCQ